MQDDERKKERHLPDGDAKSHRYQLARVVEDLSRQIELPRTRNATHRARADVYVAGKSLPFGEFCVYGFPMSLVGT